MFGIIGAHTGFFRLTQSEEIGDDEVLLKFVDEKVSALFKIKTLKNLEYFEGAFNHPALFDSSRRSFLIEDLSLQEMRLAIALLVDYASIYDVMDENSLNHPHLYETVERITRLSPFKGRRFLSQFEKYVLPYMSYDQAVNIVQKSQPTLIPSKALLYARKVVMRCLTLPEQKEGEDLCKTIHIMARMCFWRVQQINAIDDRDENDHSDREYALSQRKVLIRALESEMQSLESYCFEKSSARWVMFNKNFQERVKVSSPEWLLVEKRKALRRYEDYLKEVEDALNANGVTPQTKEHLCDFANLLHYYGYEFCESDEYPFEHPVANDVFDYELCDLGAWHLENRMREDLEKSYARKSIPFPSPIFKERKVSRLCLPEAKNLFDSLKLILADFNDQPSLVQGEVIEKLLIFNEWDKAGISFRHFKFEKPFYIDDDGLLRGDGIVFIPNVFTIKVEVIFNFSSLLVKDQRGRGSKKETVKRLKELEREALNGLSFQESI